MKHMRPVLLAAVLAAGTFIIPMSGQAATAKSSNHTYVAKLGPMNASVTHLKTSGEARFQVRGGNLIIDIRVEHAPPGVTHWQHFHGFKEGDKSATCPTAAADTNGDGIVDLIETGPASGTTMVPFDTAPAAMDVAHGHYPKASANGNYHYHEVVSLKKLSTAFAKAFNGQALDLDKRVVIIHGVPSSTKLPSSVKSLGPIPASVTLPIACGKIELMGK